MPVFYSILASLKQCVVGEVIHTSIIFSDHRYTIRVLTDDRKYTCRGPILDFKSFRSLDVPRMEKQLHNLFLQTTPTRQEIVRGVYR